MAYEKGQRTKELIFASARIAIYECGYKKATIQAIAGIAEVPTGLVNYYYKKYDILEKIYCDFFQSIYGAIEEQLGAQVENAIMRHILLTQIIMNKLFSDKKELEFYLEIIKEGLFPDKVHDLVRKQYASPMWTQFNLNMPFDKYYQLNLAEYGARKELLAKNRHLTIAHPFYPDFVNLLATITVRLAGIDAKIIEANTQKANALFPHMNCDRIIFLKDHT